MRWSVLVGLVVVGVAHAAPGNRLKEDDDAPEVKAFTSDADTALIRGLLFAFEPAPTEIRVLAVEDLGLLGDPRALNPLAQLLVDPNPAVQTAALKSIAAMRSPRSEEILSNVARHPALPDRLKLSAVQAVLFQNTVSSLVFLKQVMRGGTFGGALAIAARQALADVAPERVEAAK